MFGKPRCGDILRNIVEILPSIEGDNKNACIICFPDKSTATKSRIFCLEHRLECLKRARKLSPIRRFQQWKVINNGVHS